MKKCTSCEEQKTRKVNKREIRMSKKEEMKEKNDKRWRERRKGEAIDSWSKDEENEKVRNIAEGVKEETVMEEKQGI